MIFINLIFLINNNNLYKTIKYIKYNIINNNYLIIKFIINSKVIHFYFK